MEAALLRRKSILDKGNNLQVYQAWWMVADLRILTPGTSGREA